MIMAKKYVFISYSRHDRLIVERLTADLNQNGVEVWRDLEQIAPGSAWAEEIKKGLNQAAAMIYVSSMHSAKSEWMRSEVSAFMARQKIIIPIVIDEAGTKSIPLSLAQIQWIDFRHDYDQGLARILKTLSVELTLGAPVKTPREQSKGYAFLSYTEDDADFVEKLKEFLKEHKYAYWDYEESDRDYHGQLFLELEGVITEAAATLSVLSEAWKRSQWTVKEYFFSEEVGTPVFLLRAKEIGPTLAIAGVPYIDFVADKDKGFGKLDRELKRKKL